MRKSIKLQTRIFFSFAALIIVSTAMFGYFAYRENVNTAEENFTNVIMGNLMQMEGNITALFADLENQVTLLANSIVIQDALSGSPSRSAAEQYEDYLSVQKVINSFEQPDKPIQVRLYFEQLRMFLNDGTRYIYRPEGYPDKELYQLARRNSRVHWTAASRQLPLSRERGAEQTTFSVVSDSVSFRNGGEKLATVSIDIGESSFRKLLDNMDMPIIRNVYVIDRRGMLLTSIGGEGSLSEVPLPANLKAAVNTQEEGSLIAHNGSIPFLYVYRSIANYPYAIVAEIQTDEILNRSREIMRNFLWIALGIVFSSFLLAYGISAGVTRRIKNLVQAMGTIEQTDFMVQVRDDNNDEVGILSRKFNWMVERFRMLIEDVYKTGLEKKEAELNLLQAQINPHFLYNTLDSIHWLALKHNVKDISYMILNLSDFFRLSLNTDRKVTIRTELRHLKAYFNIQKYRFEDRIHLQIDVEASILEEEIISLILQPLVENALIHGILREEGKEGTVTVRGKREDSFIVLEVSDDGLGMEETSLQALNEHIQHNGGSLTGKGLRNVHQRIRVHFGDEYGLNIHSEPGRGTNCILIFPSLKNPEARLEEGAEEQ